MTQAAALAGDRVDYVMPSVPGSQPAALIRAVSPPASYFLSVYDAVGGQYEWRDMHNVPRADLDAFVRDEDVAIYTFLRDGWTHGFFMLDWREAGACDLAYFGLVPEAVGCGLGSYLLKTAILTGWDREGIERMTVCTCTLDHPRALAQYQRYGFQPVRQETKSRVLTRDWDPTQFP